MAVALAFREYGAGPPLLVLHGLFGSSANWGSMARSLADRHRVLCLDLRNHGQSPHTADMSYRVMAEDVERFMDDHGVDRAALLGHSLGGKTAMMLALTHAARVKQLIVVDIAPVTYSHSYAGIIQALKGLELSRITSRAEADGLLEEALPEQVLRGFLLQNLTAVDGAYRWRVNLEAVQQHEAEIKGFPVGVQTASYSGEALFLRGALSDYVSPGHYPLIHRFFPAARIHTTPAAGHWVHTEQSGEFLKAVAAFLTPNPPFPSS
ncbi:MAG: alpha/beta fold hydrolase [Gammaproteobacteria bacterium]|nr:alpha/beta fold hydrolase [Gammaproteobacteria bacterium]